MVPSTATGTAIRTQTATSEPTKAPTLSESNASTELRRKGPETKGTTASSTAAIRIRRARPARVAPRSAIRPPSQ